MKVKYIAKPEIFFVSNQTGEEVASLFDVDKKILLEQNKIEQIRCGDIFEIPNKKTYIVKPLDTIFGICKKLGISEQELMANNQIKNIFIGQLLFY